jgi:hypothetical protein
MDTFKQNQLKHMGPGGIHCTCCNFFRGKNVHKNKRILTKIVRQSLKRELRNLQLEGSA